MISTILRGLRRAVGAIGLAVLALLVGFSLFVNLAPRANVQLFIVGGGSMEPAVAVGSLAVVSPIDPSSIVVGDVITLRADNGVIVTHRVTRVVDAVDGLSFETRGDANRTADANLVPARAVIGAARAFVPYAGYLQAFLTQPGGLAGAVLMLVALLAAFMALESIERSFARPAGPAAGRPIGGASSLR